MATISVNHNTLTRRLLSGLFILMMLISDASSSWCADIIILGDAQLKPVADVIAGIRKTASSSTKTVSTSDLKGTTFSKIIATEEAKVVIALGKDAVEKALQLPASVPVICGLVISPPKSNRQNITCGLMATPASEYMAIIRQYFPALKKIAAFSSHDNLQSLPASVQGQLTVQPIDSSFDLISKLRQLSGVDALLLLPDVSILTSTALDEIFLYSFRNRVPILGVSEKHVKQGSLFAMVFDSNTIGRQLGEKASEILSGNNQIQANSFVARKFNIYLNIDTAKKMGINIPEELLRRAKKVYP